MANSIKAVTEQLEETQRMAYEAKLELAVALVSLPAPKGEDDTHAQVLELTTKRTYALLCDIEGSLRGMLA
jgi:hypothetical protein